MGESATGEPVEQPITHALEALLGGLEPVPHTSTELTKQEDLAPIKSIENCTDLIENSSLTVQTKDAKLESFAMPDGLYKYKKDLIPNGSEESMEVSVDGVGPSTSSDHNPSERIGKEIEIAGTQCQPSIRDAALVVNTVENATSSCNEKSELGDVQSAETVTERPRIPGLFLCGMSNHNEGSAHQKNLIHDSTTQKDVKSTLCVLYNGTQESAPGMTNIIQPTVLTEDLNTVENEEENVEWEVDSSPIEDSSDEDSSDSSSSDDSVEGEESYKFLSPEEQARILILGDGGSDDEGGDKSKGPDGQLRTKNEITEEIIAKPDVIVTQDMPITELGAVDQVVNNIVLIKAKVSGEYKVLESGSVLCLSDRSVFGVVAETIGRVQQPFYSVIFTNTAEILTAGLSLGTTVFFSEKHSKFVFTKNLKAYKGSDASNINDEEVGEDEIEFSDDEAEAEHKKRIKLKRQEKRGGKIAANSSYKRGRQSLQNLKEQPGGSGTISYDQNEDEPYKLLTRPANYTGQIGLSEAFSEPTDNIERNKLSFREKDKNRGRNNRHRSNANFARGRGGQNRRGGMGVSTPRNTSHQLHNESSMGNAPHPNTILGPHNSLPSQTPLINPYTTIQSSFNMPQFQEYDPRQAQLQQWPSMFQSINMYPQMNLYQPTQTTFNNWPPIPQTLPNGTFINPAFFNPQMEPPHSDIRQTKPPHPDNQPNNQ